MLLLALKRISRHGVSSFVSFREFRGQIEKRKKSIGRGFSALANAPELQITIQDHRVFIYLQQLVGRRIDVGEFALKSVQLATFCKFHMCLIFALGRPVFERA